MTHPDKADDDSHEGQRRFAPGHRLARLTGSPVLVLLLVAGLLVVSARGAIPVIGAVSTGTIAEPNRIPTASTMTDRDGRPFALLYRRYRVPATSEQIAPTMKAATVAIEDRRFYEHHGLDPLGLLRALTSNVIDNGSPLEGQGASTITMQYVKNHRLYAIADTPGEKAAAVADTVPRKLRDMWQAIRLEANTPKDQILTDYLNTIYFGNGAYGITAAARTYFDIEPDALDVPQSALLAGLVRAPTSFDPVQHPQAALGRRGLVLDAMFETGAISAAQRDTAKSAPVGIVRPLAGRGEGCPGAAPDSGFFCRYALYFLAQSGITADELREGGWTIRTTLDRAATAAAARAAAAQAPPDAAPDITNAVAIVEPGRDGHPVRALAANKSLGPDRDAGETAYPVASEPAPFGAGSIYKIFTAAAALARGLDINSQIEVPDSYTSRAVRGVRSGYTVENAGSYPSSMTLREALATSPNTTFVQLVDRLGSVTPVVDMARRLGMKRSLMVPTGDGRTIGEAVVEDQRRSYTLGPEPTSPLELANVAATLMSGGMWCPPNPIVSVTDPRGNTVDVRGPACEQAVPPGLANSLAVALSADTTGGTATEAARAAGWDRPMLGKTGTTQFHTSAGFVGATPQWAGAVLAWSSATPPRPICDGEPPRSCAEGSLFGGGVPARTWFAAMKPLHTGLAVVPLPPPDPTFVSANPAPSRYDEGDSDDDDDDDDDDDENEDERDEQSDGEDGRDEEDAD